MLKLWDADTGREMRSMGGHTGTITSVFLVPNMEISASGECYSIFYLANSFGRLQVLNRQSNMCDVKLNSEETSSGFLSKTYTVLELFPLEF